LQDFTHILFITIGAISFVFIAISVKILIKKNGDFAGTCASQNTFLNQEDESCGICGALPQEKCKN